ncbi:AMP-binding protein [Streptomyces sp. NPDC060002]|uniref:AMP-binding protein n=1 Tax=Streptomyces sp. NPDC060002 TaxID=3347033 RepID=UPI0036A94997
MPFLWPAGTRTSQTIKYTSGTTARPKGVQITHRNIWVSAVTLMCTRTPCPCSMPTAGDAVRDGGARCSADRAVQGRRERALGALSRLVDPKAAPGVLAARLTDRQEEAGGEALVRDPMGRLPARGLIQRPACPDPRCDDGIRLPEGIHEITGVVAAGPAPPRSSRRPGCGGRGCPGGVRHMALSRPTSTFAMSHSP